MSRQQSKVIIPFPLNGITELGPFEGQPDRTTPNAKNVRGFAWVDNGGTPERGRLGGGQRPGIRNFHSAANKIKAAGGRDGHSIQDINHISSDAVEVLSGRDEFPMRGTGGTDGSLGTAIHIKRDNSDQFGSLLSTESVSGSTWDDEGNLFVAVHNNVAETSIEVRKYVRSVGDSASWSKQWTSTKITENEGPTSEEDIKLQGIAWYGKYVYLRVSRTATGDNNPWDEAILRVVSSGTSADPELEVFISNYMDGSSKGDRGWTVPKDSTVPLDVTQNGLAISRGRMAILTCQAGDGGDNHNRLALYIKLVETGENVADVSKASSDATDVDAEARDLAADSRGNFWAVGKDGTNALLLEFSRFGGAPTEHLSVAKAGTKNPRSLCYDAVSDRIYVVGDEDLFDRTDGCFIAFHASEATMDFNTGNMQTGTANQVRFLRSVPFAKGDEVVITTTGDTTDSLPTGLVSDNSYRIDDVTYATADKLYRVTLKTTAETPADVDVTSTGTKGDIFTMTRVKTVARTTDDSGLGLDEEIAFQPGRNANGSAVSVWSVVRPRTGGGVWLAGHGGGNDNYRSLGLKKSNIDKAQSTTAVDSNETGANGTKMSGNAVYTFDTNLRSGARQTALVVVGGGTVKRSTSSSQPFPNVEDGEYALSSSEPVIFSAAYGKEIFYVDGMNSKYYNHDVTDDGVRGSVKDWDVSVYDGYEVEQYGLINATMGKTKGLFPVDDQGNKPRLVEVWDERIVLAGILGHPQQWYMSRRGDPTDFDYFVQPVDDEVAVAGSNSPAGLIPDKINAIIPYNDDLLLFGGDHSIFQLSGNPAMGGSIDVLSSEVGVAWGRAWCKEPGGVVYFFGSRGGVYRIVPGRSPENVTATSINERLVGIDLKKNIIRMIWNDREQGFHLFVSPTDKTLASEHYFYDARVNAWWIDEFEGKDSDVYVHNTTCPHVFDGDDPSDRVILMGGRDGRLYKWDISSPDDYVGSSASVINSHVFIGPLNNNLDNKVILSEISAIIADKSSKVSYDVYVGKTAEEILSNLGTDSTPGGEPDGGHIRFSGDFDSGKDRSDRRRATAGDIFIKLKNVTVAQNWALERIVATMGVSGRVNSRGFDSGRRD
mgnify:CR=1 FL=1